ncbi:hypothetical protein [Niastella sp. OAS944]|uniref:hypothetical protein n=1 Tax=Niastella sp. OAS944 TaxID=2664089 RepID=UPI003486C2E5|nr:hypothetical protein [Chitinophagaceae bacterium OAS944]
MKNIGITIAGFIVLVLSTSSCKKTVENWKDVKAEAVKDTVIARENNRIISYKVQSPTAEGIYAAVNDSDNTINVYLPYFYALNFLEVASIGLPAGAAISPSVDELVPVFSNSPFTYTVTAADKTTRKYSVKVIVLQEKLLINELSTASVTRTYALNFGANPVVDVYFSITGSNIVPSADYTTLHLMDAASGGKEVLTCILSPSEAPLTTFMYYYYRYDKNDASTWRIKANTDYWFEVRSYNRIYRMTYPVRFSGI